MGLSLFLNLSTKSCILKPKLWFAKSIKGIVLLELILIELLLKNIFIGSIILFIFPLSLLLNCCTTLGPLGPPISILTCLTPPPLLGIFLFWLFIFKLENSSKKLFKCTLLFKFTFLLFLLSLLFLLFLLFPVWFSFLLLSWFLWFCCCCLLSSFSLFICLSISLWLSIWLWVILNSLSGALFSSFCKSWQYMWSFFSDSGNTSWHISHVKTSGNSPDWEDFWSCDSCTLGIDSEISLFLISSGGFSWLMFTLEFEICILLFELLLSFISNWRLLSKAIGFSSVHILSCITTFWEGNLLWHLGHS